MSAIQGMTGSSQDLRSNFLHLLVTELRNQNPLEPMDNGQMTSQLAQLSQLEHLEHIDNTFQMALFAVRLQEAMDMIGGQVVFFPADSDTSVSGKVESVDIVDGDVSLKVGDYSVGLDDVRSISK